MRTRTVTSSDPLLDDVRRYAETEDRARLAKLIAVLDWAAAHEADHVDALALVDPFVEPALHLAGPGAPVVPEFAAMELAMTLGMSTDGGLRYLAKALELCHRLPRLYRRVVNHEVPLFKAFRVAEATISLPEAGAWHVDKTLTPFLHNCSWSQIDRAVEAARDEHDPDEAERRRKVAAEHRKADVYLDSAHDGVVDMVATMDAADAIDLEQALKDGAQQLADLGSTESLDVRRSQALGEIARQQQALDFESGGGRGVTVYAHFDGLDPDLPGTLDNLQATLLIEQLKAWCQVVGTKVTVKPVIDLGADISTTSYVPTDAIREVVTLRDRCCVFPGCTRRRVDLATSSLSTKADPPPPGTSRCCADATTAPRPTAAGPTAWSNQVCTSGPAPPARPRSSTGVHHTADDPDRPDRPARHRCPGLSAWLRRHALP